MAATVSIRAMTAGDIPDVLSLEEECFAEPWPRSMFESELPRGDRHYAVIAAEDGIAAYAGMMFVGADGHIMTLAVAPAARRKGLATRLLLELIDVASERRVEHLTLEVRESNVGARRLYERFGFHEVGVRPGYYRNEDAVIMWALDINDSDYRARLDDLAGRLR